MTILPRDLDASNDVTPMSGPLQSNLPGLPVEADAHAGVRIASMAREAVSILGPGAVFFGDVCLARLYLDPPCLSMWSC